MFANADISDASFRFGYAVTDENGNYTLNVANASKQVGVTFAWRIVVYRQIRTPPKTPLSVPPDCS